MYPRKEVTITSVTTVIVTGISIVTALAIVALTDIVTACSNTVDI